MILFELPRRFLLFRLGFVSDLCLRGVVIGEDTERSIVKSLLCVRIDVAGTLRGPRTLEDCNPSDGLCRRHHFQPERADGAPTATVCSRAEVPQGTTRGEHQGK